MKLENKNQQIISFEKIIFSSHVLVLLLREQIMKNRQVRPSSRVLPQYLTTQTLTDWRLFYMYS